MVRFLPFHGYMCCSLVGSGAVHLRKISGVPCHKVPGSSIRIGIISRGVLLLPNVLFLIRYLKMREEILWLPTPVIKIVDNCVLLNKVIVMTVRSGVSMLVDADLVSQMKLLH